MAPTAPHNKPIPETHLQRTLTSVINELPVDAALAAVFHRDQGPLVSHAARGFTPRDIQAILRTLSAPAIAASPPANDQEGGRTIRLRLITPGTKSLLGVSLLHRNRTYGFLVIGRKESATFAKKEKSLMEQASDLKSEQKDGKKDLKPGHRLTLDSSASGWAVRHRKPRVDHDLASTQGRFLDHKYLFKDRLLSSLVVPFFVRGQVGGTITLASKEAGRYQQTDARTLEPTIVKIADILQAPAPAPTSQAPVTGPAGAPGAALATGPSEPIIRKQERQAAIGVVSLFLAKEVREPLASIRAQLEEVTGEGILDFDPQTRVENAMRDLIRIEAILNEILDFAKPLELTRRLLRIPEVIESALTVVATDLEVTRIQVTKDYATMIAPVRGDEAKLQQVFLSIFENAGEAMKPGGHLHIQVTQHRAGRGVEDQILIKNDGAPIPAEIVDKVFEPFFTTKRTGIGLGLATVKKIVEEHGGSIAIGSAPGEGTTVTIRLPGLSHGPSFRRRGRRRPPARRQA